MMAKLGNFVSNEREKDHRQLTNENYQCSCEILVVERCEIWLGFDFIRDQSYHGK
jgi:hypothetical protein